MKVVIAGGSGFLGRALSERLAADTHEIVVLTRSTKGVPSPRAGAVSRQRWDPADAAAEWAPALVGAGAIVNLAGESIAGHKWTADYKKRIKESRLLATRALVGAIAALPKAPSVFISGSAVGYYGDREDEPLTETSSPGRDFLSGVCLEWESAASHAATKTRVALIRTGIVLSRSGGALPRIMAPFRLFAGGPIGSGQQYMSWIHLADWVDLMRWVMLTEVARGPINATSPKPVPNVEFSKALGKALHRPSWLPAPAFALRSMMGEMADALLFSSQKALPQRATSLGFRFKYPEIGPALQNILGPQL